ncbi:GRAMD1A [Bugula neritina]|uniref:GRAMD1A n=1 Tax=Bugula neritina TaxID=10212 RepID=A0A7J7JI48_BUGNE|nr:GRAMD1A [Bugula neritina]
MLAAPITGSSFDSGSAGNALGTSRGGMQSLSGGLRKSQSYAETLAEQKIEERQPKKKYLKRFEKIFWPLVGEERLFNCYSCALYQDSIASGHLYLTFNWFCFYSNFIGRQRQVAIDVSRIQNITQEKTAKIIPNAIKISTDSDTYVFSSFISRDKAYKTLVGVWRKSEEVATLSCEESDLSDVDSMTQIVAMPGYSDAGCSARPRSESDSMSEVSDSGFNGEQEERQQVEITADVIEFTAPSSSTNDISIANTSTSKDTSAEVEVPLVEKHLTKSLQCNSEPVLWKGVERFTNFPKSMLKWCSFQVSDGSEALLVMLMVCTGLIAAMSVYLGIRLCLFENEQLTYSIKRQLQIHETNLHLQVEATIEQNHRLISQLSNMLSMLEKVVAKAGCLCSQQNSLQ